jgi:SAM-dependent methyltransferase
MELRQHQAEILANQQSWSGKPLLREIYDGFYKKICHVIDLTREEPVLEIGAGMGNLKAILPRVICTDLFPNPWLDLVCDGYKLPFKDQAFSHLILFDVFHHLKAPSLFLKEARRVLAPRGRVILFEPYISVVSWFAYELVHHEPVAWRAPIDLSTDGPAPADYYAAQGNATRLFFRGHAKDWLAGWSVVHRERFATFAYLLSGGFSKPALYPRRLLPALRLLDRGASMLPSLFGARCLVALERK